MNWNDFLLTFLYNENVASELIVRVCVSESNKIATIQVDEMSAFNRYIIRSIKFQIRNNAYIFLKILIKINIHNI